MDYIPKVMKFANEDVLLLRWFLNYEELFPNFEDFKKALQANSPGPKMSVKEIMDDVANLMTMNWEEQNGERN